jgi:UDP-N-acetylglucosamine--N-acetylmuramyl-(pentapeptide) pyrophosphoryl-undecaprenol N-acetylglucosamine transferase
MNAPASRRDGGILFCGGGTGGHVLPGLAVAAALRAQGVQKLRWIGDPERIEASLVPEAGIPLLPWGLSRPRPLRPAWWLQALRRGLGGSREFLCRPPAAVVALGGYAALLPGLLAALLRRPLVVMEQNARAGRTNRLLARRAAAVVVQFPEAIAALPRARCHLLGNPVRDLPRTPRGAAATLTLLVMGGSLAARSLNDLLVAAAPALAAVPGLRVIHLAGETDRERVAAAYAAAGLSADVRGFEKDMPSLYAVSDLALCRSGATTVAELCVAGIGAIYIPLPWAAEDHQTANARAVARVGGAVVIDQRHATPAGLARVVSRLARQRQLTAQLGSNAARLARPQAAADAARLVRAVAARGTAGFRP